MPTAIGVMVTALALSLALVALDALGLAHGLREYEESLLRSIDFSDVLMQGMLSMLLFAGALHVDLSELQGLPLADRLRWPCSARCCPRWPWVTACGSRCRWVGLPLPLIYCLLFGALISPTDPIAVMGILKSAGAPKDLELVIAGESLFNDGVGVVIFSLAAGHAGQRQRADPRRRLCELLLHEAGGGLLFGLVLGYVTFRLLQERRQLPGRGAADPGRRDRRLRIGQPACTSPGRWRWSWRA